MDVTIRQLRYFVSVADRLHFTAAAEELYVSQPALSKQIRALENLLKVTLFDRDRRSVRLTSAGQVLLPQARVTLAAWDAAQRDLSRLLAGQRRTLTVGMSTGVGRGLLPASRSRFTRALPDAELKVQQVPWSDPTGGLAGSVGTGADVAFVWLPQPDPARLDRLEVATERRFVALPAGHPLADRDEVAFADLLGDPFLRLPASSGVLADFWLALDQRGGRPPVIGGEVTTTEETVEAVSSGAGVVLVAEGNVPLVTRNGIVARPVPELPPAVLVLAWRRTDHRDLVATFRACVEDTVRAYGGPNVL